MIELPVDEAYALDYYAILLVKADRGLPVQREIGLVGHALKKQLPTWFEAIASPQFQDLYKANAETFDAVGKCRESAAQKANRKRFTAKKALQERFWPDNPLTERKRKGD